MGSGEMNSVGTALYTSPCLYQTSSSRGIRDFSPDAQGLQTSVRRRTRQPALLSEVPETRGLAAPRAATSGITYVLSAAGASDFSGQLTCSTSSCASEKQVPAGIAPRSSPLMRPQGEVWRLSGCGNNPDKIRPEPLLSLRAAVVCFSYFDG